jgi:hypothetical protein
VGVYPDRQAFLADEPLRVVEVPIDTEHRHLAMAKAEEEVRETVTGLENDKFEIWAVDAEEQP